MPFPAYTKIKGVSYLSVSFHTRSYAALRIIYDMFIVDGVKVIPHNIYELFDSIAFGHLIMGDGGGHDAGWMIICTDLFTLPDVVMLMNVLRIK